MSSDNTTGGRYYGTDAPRSKGPHPDPLAELVDCPTCLIREAISGAFWAVASAAAAILDLTWPAVVFGFLSGYMTAQAINILAEAHNAKPPAKPQRG